MAEEEVVKAISTLIEALTPLDKEAREHVLEFVLKRLGIVLFPAGHALQQPQLNPLDGIPSPPPTPPERRAEQTDIRSFAAAKQPQTLNEKVAVVAYYLTQLAPTAERRDYITPDDIKPYFIQANFELPTGPTNMTLTNAKNAGYLNALERGQYKLNSVGHNLVAHKLPSRDAPKRRTAKRNGKIKK